MISFDFVSIIINSMLLSKKTVISYYLSLNLKIDWLKFDGLLPWIYQEYTVYFELKKDTNGRLYLKLNLNISNIWSYRLDLLIY